MNDKKEKQLPHSDLTGSILNCCFELMNELGPGFLERVYKNALLMAMKEKGLQVEVERPYNVIFRGKIIGRYNADLVVNDTVIVELFLSLKSLHRSIVEICHAKTDHFYPCQPKT